MSGRPILFGLGLICASLAWAGDAAFAQPKPGLRPKASAPAKPGDVRSTTVELVLLTEGNGAQAQQWRTALEPLEIAITFRRGLEEEKLETKEKIFGTLRKVTATGRMERSGRLIFADRAFDPGERQKIKQWVSDLQTYGAQGTPEGKPLWGLTEEQFAAIYVGLTEPVADDLSGEELEAAIRKLPLPREYPVRWSDEAKQRIERSSRKKVVRQSPQGFSVATALALMLNDHGLGFRPGRTPGGDLELVIEVPENATHVWPVGWPLKLSRQKAAPKFFALQQVFFDDVPLDELLAKGSQAAEIPILLDYADLDRQGGDWAQITISQLPRQATWHTVLRDALNKGKLTFDLWQDESGRPFLYVTSLKGKRNAPK